MQALTSYDGRFVTFVSSASNLVPGDTNGVDDVFVVDMWFGGTTRISVDSVGNQGDSGSGSDKAPVSADGRYIAFASSATNLVAGDTNSALDVFRHDGLTGETIRVSVDVSGIQIHGNSSDASMSGDGQRIAFDSDAPDAWGSDANGQKDVFVYDVSTGYTQCVSLSPSGWTSNGESLKPAISADGRLIAFTSSSSDLVPGDTNGVPDTFVYDIGLAEMRRVSVDSLGIQANGLSISVRVAISQEGRYVAFLSLATNLVPNDTNAVQDLFVHDNWTGTSERVSTGLGGMQSNGSSQGCSISADGRFVSFSSFATNLVADDTNGVADVFVKDRYSGTTARVSLDDNEQQGNGASTVANLSGDGRIVVFQSLATNLVPGDTNGMGDVFARLWQYSCGASVSTYCTSMINTTGAAAMIDWQGTTSVSQNDFVLKVSQCPPLHWGVFFYGRYQTAVPFGEGLLCVTGSQHRLSILQVGPNGSASYPLDFTAPQCAGLQPDSAWNFQFWYRDPQPVGHGFNLSDALNVQFCP